MTNNALNRRTDNSEDTTLRLAQDVGKMADRIGDMADRIGVMADRILETQEIQGKSLQQTQDAVLRAVEFLSRQAEDNHRLLERLVTKLEQS